MDASTVSTAATASSVLDPAADQSRAIDVIWHLMLWICVPMYALVLVGIAIAIWRLRSIRKHEVDSPMGDRGLARAFALWIALTALGLVVLTAASFTVDRRLIPGADAALNVRITGHQWWWQIEYLSDDPTQQFTTANELHLPVDQKIHVELRSGDVIHSFWVPNLAGKRDLIPGRINEIELTPRRAGTFRGTCAEFCGLQHAKMALRVDIEDAAAFDIWRKQQVEEAKQPSEALEREGQALFVSTACVLCHTVRGTAAASHAGPDLTHLASRHTLAAGALPLDRGSLAAWLSAPQQLKPGTNMPKVDLAPEQLGALVAYLASLK